MNDQVDFTDATRARGQYIFPTWQHQVWFPPQPQPGLLRPDSPAQPGLLEPNSPSAAATAIERQGENNVGKSRSPNWTDTEGAYHLAKKSGNFGLKSIRKLWTTSRGTPLFPFGTEHRKFPYHLNEFSVSRPFLKTSARFETTCQYGVFLQMWFVYVHVAYYGKYVKSSLCYNTMQQGKAIFVSFFFFIFYF